MSLEADPVAAGVTAVGLPVSGAVTVSQMMVNLPDDHQPHEHQQLRLH